MNYTPTGTVNLPISVDVAKQWLRVTHDLEDAKIEAVLKAAFSFAESYTGQTFHDQAWTLTASPAEVFGGLMITKAPISGIDLVKMRKDNGQEIFLTNNDYTIITTSSRAYFFVKSNYLYDVVADLPYAFEINFMTGAGLPAHIENAIKMLVAFMYENAGDVPTVNNNSAPPEALLLLQSERVGFI